MYLGSVQFYLAMMAESGSRPVACRAQMIEMENDLIEREFLPPAHFGTIHDLIERLAGRVPA
jgi:hypothetical protein